MVSGPISDVKNGVTFPCYRGEEKAALTCMREKVPAIVNFLGSNKFLIGDNVTWIDFYFFEAIELMAFVNKNFFAEFPPLEVYHKNVRNLPKLKEYLDDPNCLDMKRPFNNKAAKINSNP